MKLNMQKKSIPFGVRCLGLAAIATGGLLAGVLPASADVVGPGAYCVLDNLGINKLNCTANDTNLAGVKLDANGDPIISPATCTEGETFLLSATFELATNASERYDIGVTFSSDGDPNGDGADTGECSRTLIPHPPAENLDGDTCGDLKSVNSPYDLEVTDLSVKCVDTDVPPDGLVNLPYIVSWAQNATSVCNNAAQALPGTTSKCERNDTFNIPVRIETPTNTLTKAATVRVTYSIVFTNSALTLYEKLTSLTDSAYNNITTSGHDGIISTTCAVPQTLGPNDADINTPPNTYSCSFVVAPPVDGTTVSNVLTVAGLADNDPNLNPDPNDLVTPPTPIEVKSNNNTAVDVTVTVGP